MLNDLRYAIRALGASRGFTIAAVLTLALGIGANTAIFTAVYGVLLKPLPYGEPDRLVRISETRRGGAWNVSYPNYVDWRARNQAFESMAIFNTYVARVDESTAVGTIRIVADAMAATYGDRRSLTWLLMMFAALSLGLTVLGIGSVVAFTVAQRVPEIGTRIALGAEPSHVVRMIVGASMYPVLAGGVMGLLALIPLVRAYRSYLFGVGPGDPVSLAAAAGVLLVAAAVAAWIPARRAATIDPLRAVKAS